MVGDVTGAVSPEVEARGGYKTQVSVTKLEHRSVIILFIEHLSLIDYQYSTITLLCR